MKERLLFHWQRLGAVGRIGALAWLAGLSLWLGKVLPAELQLQAQASAVENSSRQPPTPLVRRTIEDFYGHFPAADTLPEQLQALDRRVAELRLGVRDVVYQLHLVDGLALQRYQVDLPLSGDYLAIRMLLLQTLAAADNAVIDEVRFERSAGGSTAAANTVVARLRLSFYYRAAPTLKAAP